MVRAIVGGIMQQAVLHQAVAANPIRDLERIESPMGHRKAPPRGLTAEERRSLLAFVDTDKTAIRADLPDLIRFALGSGLRVGEIYAVRLMDLDLNGIPIVSQTDMRLVPVVAVRQNVYPVKGKGLRAPAARAAAACWLCAARTGITGPGRCCVVAAVRGRELASRRTLFCRPARAPEPQECCAPDQDRQRPARLSRRPGGAAA